MKNKKYTVAMSFIKKKHHKESLLDRVMIVFIVSFAVFIISAAFFMEPSLKPSDDVPVFNTNYYRGLDLIGRTGFVIGGLYMLVHMKIFSYTSSLYSSEAWNESLTAHFASTVGDEVFKEITLLLINRDKVFSNNSVFEVISILQAPPKLEPVTISDQLKAIKG